MKGELHPKALIIQEWPFLLIRFQLTAPLPESKTGQLKPAAVSRTFLNWAGYAESDTGALSAEGLFADQPALSEWWHSIRMGFMKGDRSFSRSFTLRHENGLVYRVQAEASADSISLLVMPQQGDAEEVQPETAGIQAERAGFQEEKVLMCRYLKDGTFTYMNEAFVSFFEMPSEPQSGSSNLFELLTEEEKPEVERFIEKVLSGTEKCCYLSEFTINGQQRRVLWFEKLLPGSPPVIESVGYELSAFLYQKHAFDLKMQQQQAILEAIPYYIFAKDADKRYLFANSRFAAAFGHTASSIIGLNDSELSDNDEWNNKYMNSDEEVLRSGQLVVMQPEYEKRNEGGYGWFQTIKVPYYHPGQKKPGVLGIALDITERKTAMDELARQKEQFEVAIRGINDGIWDWNLREKSIFFSPKWKEQLGYRDDEIPNETSSFQELLHPDDQSVVYDYIDRYHRGETERYDIEFRMRHKAGHYIWIHSRGDALRDENGIPYRMAGSHTDITRRKKDEAALLESRQRYASVIKAIPDMIFSLRRDGTYLDCHSPSDELLFVQPEYFIGKKIEDVLPEELAVKFLKAMDAVFEGDSQQIVEYELEVSGRNKYFEARFVQSDADEILSIVRDVTDEIKAKGELLHTQKMLLQTNKMAKVGAWEYDLRLKQLHWSDMAYTIFGKSRDAFSPLLDEVVQLYEEQSARHMMQAIEKLIAEGEPYDIESQIRKPDGSLKWVRSIGDADFENGICVRIYGSVQDIDLQKRNQLELESTRQKLQSIFAEMSEAIWSLRLPDYNVNFATPSFENVFGVKISEWAQNQAVCQQFVHPEDYPGLLEQYKKLIQTGSYSIEYRIIKNGEVRWLHEKARNICNAEGVPVRVDGFTSDITREKEAEAEREHYSEMLSLLFRIASTFINPKLDQFDTDIEAALGLLGVFVESDRVYIFDYHLDRMVTDNTYEWCAPGVEPVIEMMQDVPIDLFRPCYECHLKREVFYAPDTSLIEDEALRQLMADQMIKSIITLPMYEADVLIGFVGFDSVKSLRLFTEKETNLLKIFADVLTNVQQRIRLERELKQARETAEDASRAKSLFVANMSHEIRTPLNGVIGFTELMQDTRLDSEQQQYLDNIQVSAESLLAIISDILDFSKIEAGKLELEYLPTDLYTIAAEATDIIKHQAAVSGLSLLMNVPYGSLPLVMTDAIRLKQILVNLLSNAVKFSEEGEVELIVQPKALAGDRLTVYFEVRDTGIGIGEETRDKLFRSFSQADNSMTRRFGGTGLGLVICSLLLERMGSKIDFVSEEGKGSRFFFEVGFSVAGDATGLPVPSFEGKTAFLLIENQREAWLMQERMRELGFRFQTFNELSSLERAIAGIKPAEQPPVILADLKFFLEAAAQGTPKPGIHSAIVLHSVVDTQQAEALISSKKALARVLKPANISELAKILVKFNEECWARHAPERGNLSQVVANTHAGKTVMIVEDVKLNMILARTLVNKILPNTHIIEAENGRLAVRKFEELDGLIDLILMDIQMPEMDGIEATKLIRQSEAMKGRHTPIIALTAGVVKEEKKRCFEAGIDYFISKPVDADVLKKSLVSLLIKDHE